MIPKQVILKNELIKEIVTIRIDTLYKMLALKKEDKLPRVDYEGATGDLDNAGGIFIPGGIVFEDSDEQVIKYKKIKDFSKKRFSKEIRMGMRDNATLLYKDGIAMNVTLDNGFFSSIARNIIINKKAAHKRNKIVTEKSPLEFDSDDITRSHAPLYMEKPYGTRTKISSCVQIGLIEPNMFYTHSIKEYKLRNSERGKLAKSINSARKPILTIDNEVLAQPYVVVCHDTRYSSNNLTGLTRILGIGKFGEFATITFEEANKNLLEKISKKRTDFQDHEIAASYEGINASAVLRVYGPTNPGKRAKNYHQYIISPERDLGINLEEISKKAIKRYGL